MKRILLAAGFLLVLGGCYNDKYDKLYPTPINACDTTAITYSHDILPIIVANCYNPGGGCHDATGSAASGRDFQTNIGPLQNCATNGTLITDINGTTNPMPKGAPKLSECEINKITRWVHLGAPNN